VLNVTLAKRRRRELDLTLAQVGALVGVDSDTIQRWETGSREPRNTESLRRYARALKVEPGELVAEPEPEAEAVEAGVGGVAATAGVRSEGPSDPDVPAVFPAATPSPRSRAS
jgi:transcriptional regulator with XRE-family HTH domain